LNHKDQGQQAEIERATEEVDLQAETADQASQADPVNLIILMTLNYQ
jgi:hypothetical protein